MSIARKDDRHNEDLAREIADSFNTAIGARERDEDAAEQASEAPPRFVVTGDQRAAPKRRREGR